jgi:hypothetical protein
MNYPLYNDKLAPIWNINEDGARLDDEVRKSLIKIAMDFVQDLKKNQDRRHTSYWFYYQL